MKIKTIFSKIRLYIRNILHHFGYDVRKIGPYSIFNFESFLYRHIEVHKKLTFLQIGANDGIMNDPIYRFNIKNRNIVGGYVLEPVPDIYARLVDNYKRIPSVKAFNIAIHPNKSEMIMYRVKPGLEKNIPKFAGGIASFDESHWRKTSLVPDESYIEQVLVKCISFKDFIEANGIESLDLLLLDTEGYDFQILKSIDFSKIRPKIIRFEHGIRDGLMSRDDFTAICGVLNAHGYQIIAESYDATAYILDSSDLIF